MTSRALVSLILGIIFFGVSIRIYTELDKKDRDDFVAPMILGFILVGISSYNNFMGL